MRVVRRRRGSGSAPIGRSSQTTPGRAFAVIARPTTTITERRERGQRANERAVERDAREEPAGEHRHEADRGDRRGEAEAERDDQRQSEADPVEGDRAQQHDERGRAREQPGGHAHTQEPPGGEGIVVLVAVVVVVAVLMAAVVMTVHAAHAEPPAQHGEPDPDDEEPRDEREPRVELLGDEEPREEERHETQAEHAGSVGHGDRGAQEERVPRSPPGAHEVPGDEGLAVAGSQGVRGTPEGRHEQRDEDDADRQLAALDQRLEAAADMGRSRPGPERWCCSGHRARHEAGSGRPHVEGRREELLRVGTEHVRAALGRHRGGDEPHAVTRPQGHLAPADPVGVAFGRRTSGSRRSPASRTPLRSEASAGPPRPSAA